MIFKSLRKPKDKKKSILELSSHDQKKIYSKAAKESTKLQTDLLKKYDSSFGERIQKSR